MALTGSQQILEAIKRSARPLICVSAGAGADGYAAALGLSRVLRKLDRRADIVAADGAAPGTLSFLDGHGAVKTAVDHLRRFVIELDLSAAKVKELSYETKDGKLLIHVTPASGSFDPKDLKVSDTGFRYDLLVCVGAADFEACGELFRAHPDFFYATPVINVDHRPENEHFGQFNVVDVTASACGEVCHDLVESLDPSLMDEETATAFLTGMIAKTKSFTRPNVTPKTLQTAGKLVAHGARREEAVRRLYRTRSVQTLRLWGRALARLKQDADAPLVWSALSRQDFLHAGAEDADVEDVIDELITSSPDAKVTALVYETADRSVRALVQAEHPFDALALCGPLGATGTREHARLRFPDRDAVQAERLLLERLRAQMKNRPA